MQPVEGHATAQQMGQCRLQGVRDGVECKLLFGCKALEACGVQSVRERRRGTRKHFVPCLTALVDLGLDRGSKRSVEDDLVRFSALGPLDALAEPLALSSLVAHLHCTAHAAVQRQG